MDIISSLSLVGSGLLLTLELTIGGVAIGLVLGAFLAVLRYNRYFTHAVSCFISIVRGTPLILQLSFIFFALPMILDVNLSVTAAGIIAFGMNSACYVSEIIRGGIESLPKGQFEAASALQIPQYYMWRDIILPQVLRNVTPSIVNEVITLLKETALISTIGGMDIMRHAQLVAAEDFSYFTPLCIAGAYYYLLIVLIEYAGRKIENAGKYAKNK